MLYGVLVIYFDFYYIFYLHNQTLILIAETDYYNCLGTEHIPILLISYRNPVPTIYDQELKLPVERMDGNGLGYGWTYPIHHSIHGGYFFIPGLSMNPSSINRFVHIAMLRWSKWEDSFMHLISFIIPITNSIISKCQNIITNYPPYNI